MRRDDGKVQPASATDSPVSTSSESFAFIVSRILYISTKLTTQKFHGSYSLWQVKSRARAVPEERFRSAVFGSGRPPIERMCEAPSWTHLLVPTEQQP